MLRLASGELDARLDSSSRGDDIDALVVGLNMLADELRGLTEELEERVEQRTSQLATAHAELEHLALYDPLTNLANRTLLADRIRQAMLRADRGAEAPAVLVLDLDGFKAVNDSFGHLVGDELLVTLAGRLRAVVREGDTVARLGGDEFAVVVVDASDEQVLEIAERIGVAMAAPVVTGAQTCWVSASVGVRFGTRGQTGDTFLRDADTAMYAAKSRSRGGVSVFEPSMHAAALSRLRQADELRAALGSTDQLFVLYQPVIELATGRVAGAEALVRWAHPERGLLMPDVFVPLAEDSGLVAALDRFVLDAALVQVARWRSTVLGDHDFAVHVNVSPVELRAPRFAEGVLGRLDAHGVRTADVTVEITENQLLGEDVPTLQAMDMLRAAGVGIAIDDFGTGSSSLGYVRRSFVDTIKVDRSLVRGLDDTEAQHGVAAAVIGVVDAFGLQAVAEGVETAGEAASLLALGCRYGQGYHWSLPLTADALTPLLGREVRWWGPRPRPRRRDADPPRAALP